MHHLRVTALAALAAFGCSRVTSALPDVTDATALSERDDVLDRVDVHIADDVLDRVDVHIADDVLDRVDVHIADDVLDRVDVLDAGDRPVLNEAAICPGAQSACAEDGGTVCVDTSSNLDHCGGCGRRCCVGQFCSAGACVHSCGSARTLCRPHGAICPVCFDLFTDPRNCGACDNACAAGQICAAGRCELAACAPVSQPSMPMGVCDGRGRIACQMWAQALAGGNPNAVAACVAEPAGCVRADQCTDLRDRSTCRCGIDPPCGVHEVCVLSGPTARCVCATPSA